jgi:hypothetical protein
MTSSTSTDRRQRRRYGATSSTANLSIASAPIVSELAPTSSFKSFPVPKWHNDTWLSIPAEYDRHLREFVDCPGDYIDCIMQPAKDGMLQTGKMLKFCTGRISVLLAQEKQKRSNIPDNALSVLSESNRKIATLTAIQTAFAAALQNRPAD